MTKGFFVAQQALCHESFVLGSCKCGHDNERLLLHMIETVVYNARKRGEDRASDYFRRTENVAGVKDMRFQALMPDILHWLGIKKIDRMLSMSK
jgi:GTP cyclohydrolase II